MLTDGLLQAIKLVKSGKQAQARNLILQEIKNDPDNLTAWLWALEVALTSKEKRAILGKILSLDPTHKEALVYQNKLDLIESRQIPTDQTSLFPEKSPDIKRTSFSTRLRGLIQLFAAWLASLPSGCGIIAFFLVLLAGLFLYTRVNTNFFGLIGADFNDLVISNSYKEISSPDYTWEIEYEVSGKSSFIGTVRHAAPIRIPEFSILTHDILVTSGDFAKPEIVTTTVFDHKFIWNTTETNSLKGSIHLVHALPANQEIYQSLLEIQNGDIVNITGWEIFTVKAFKKDGTPLSIWKDAGCNTLLVESVTILHSTQKN